MFTRIENKHTQFIFGRNARETFIHSNITLYCFSSCRSSPVSLRRSTWSASWGKNNECEKMLMFYVKPKSISYTNINMEMGTIVHRIFAIFYEFSTPNQISLGWLNCHLSINPFMPNQATTLTACRWISHE